MLCQRAVLFIKVMVSYAFGHVISNTPKGNGLLKPIISLLYSPCAAIYLLHDAGL